MVIDAVSRHYCGATACQLKLHTERYAQDGHSEMTVVRVSRDSVRAGFAIQQAAHYLRFRRQALQRKLRSRAASWQKAKVQAWVNYRPAIRRCVASRYEYMTIYTY